MWFSYTLFKMGIDKFQHTTAYERPYRIPAYETRASMSTRRELEWQHWCVVICFAFVIMCAAIAVIVPSQIHDYSPHAKVIQRQTVPSIDDDNWTKGKDNVE